MRNKTRRHTKPTRPAPARSGVSWKYSALTSHVWFDPRRWLLLLLRRQHFSSMDYGIKNSKLRKQMDELESEKTPSSS
jgi:hypothetical protein